MDRVISKVNTKNKNMIEVLNKLLFIWNCTKFFAFKSYKLFYPFKIKIVTDELANLSLVSVNEL